MSFRIKGTNFQSWESFDLQADGLTVATGDNNLGKSAICRAAMGVLRNELNVGQIRLGADLMTVDAEIDGHTIHAERKRKGSVTYTVDGEVYEKLDGDIPEPMKSLGVGSLSIGEVKLDPIFARPVGSNFLLDKLPSELNAILGAFSSTGKLESGKREAASRIAAKNTEAKLLAIELRGAEERRFKLQGLEARAAALQAEIDELETSARRAEALHAAYSDLIEHTTKLESIQATLKVIHVPDMETAANTHALYHALGEAVEAKTQYERTKSFLDRLHVPDTAPAEASFELTLNAGEAAAATLRLTAAQKTISAVTSLVSDWKEFVAEWKLGRAYEEMADALSNRRSAGIAQKLSAAMEEIEALIATINIEAANSKNLGVMIDSKRKLSENQLAIHLADKKLEKARAAVSEIEAAARYAESLTVCPACGETISLQGNNLCQQPAHKHATFSQN